MKAMVARIRFETTHGDFWWRFVRSVEEKQDGRDWTVEALVRSKSAEQTWFQVRVTFAVSHGTTSVLQHVCSCKK
jgi:hypothetical protein